MTALLGIAVPSKEIEAILTSLGFTVKREGDAMHVTVPSFRADVGREVDLIEEIARVFGFDLIPPTLPSGMRVKGGLSDYQRAEREISRVLAGLGMNEVITYSFIAPDFADRIRLADDDPRRKTVTLANPLSVDQSVLRTTMLPSLLMTVAANLSMRNPDVNIFETGRVYMPVEGEKLPDEKRAVAGCLCGSLSGLSWLGESRKTDYFTGKGMVEAVFAAVKGGFTTGRCDELFLHPGKSAFIMVDGKRAGFMGEVHPLVLEAFDIDRPVVAFEILEDVLIGSSTGTVIFEDLITFPASFQDLAVVVDEGTASEELIDVVRKAGAPLLRSARLFDIYTGDQVGEGKKSMALSLEFRSSEGTLTDEDVDRARRRIISELDEKLGGVLRT